MKYFFIYFLLLFCHKTWACECNGHFFLLPIEQLETIENNQLIFKGNLQRVDTIHRSYQVKMLFKVENYYVGTYPTDTISIYTHYSSSSCGLYQPHRIRSKHWIIFAYKGYDAFSASLDAPYYTANSCGRSLSLDSTNYNHYNRSDYYREYIDFFEQLQKVQEGEIAVYQVNAKNAKLSTGKDTSEKKVLLFKATRKNGKLNGKVEAFDYRGNLQYKATYLEGKKLKAHYLRDNYRSTPAAALLEVICTDNQVDTVIQRTYNNPQLQVIGTFDAAKGISNWQLFQGKALLQKISWNEKLSSAQLWEYDATNSVSILSPKLLTEEEYHAWFTSKNWENSFDCNFRN
ncbi:MAG: hypothetical protein ACKVTZ_19495 [Bacteroidia bacterium]